MDKLFIGEMIHIKRLEVAKLSERLDDTSSLTPAYRQRLRARLSRHYQDVYYFDATFCSHHHLSSADVDACVEAFHALTLDDYFHNYRGKYTLTKMDLFGPDHDED